MNWNRPCMLLARGSRTLGRSLILIALFCGSSFAQQSSVAPAEVREILARAKGFEVGFLAKNLNSGHIVAAHDADRALIPASNQKILTTAAALLAFGSSGAFRTELVAHGVVTDQVVHGSLRLWSNGDPTLEATRTPIDLARAVRDAGITRVTGDLLLDDRSFGGGFTGPNWPKDEPTRAYMAEVNALSLDYGMMSVRVTGGASVSERPRVVLEPASSGWTLDSRLSTCEASKDQLVHVVRRDKDRVIQVTGKVWKNTNDQPHAFAIHDSAEVFGHVLKQSLQDAGVQLDGRVRRPESDQEFVGGRRLAFVETPHTSAYPPILKRSQNHCAEMLFKHLGVSDSGAGTFAASGEQLTRLLQGAQVRTSGLVAADGSGLSRDNRVAPITIVDILTILAARDDFADYREWLPHGGEASSTLSRRLQDVGQKVRAKTGTLSTVVALSGYVETMDGSLVAFSVLTNASDRGRTAKMRDLCDDLVRSLSRMKMKR
jgi:D-alanyl-D-alanine carboxypeptidase/D-alanyl-D-alanine-endopeptidase (penicillin-binding protein 4)